MRQMKLSEIKIKDSFASTTPKEKKMEACRNYWNEHGKQDRYIVVDHDNILVDGYIQYLVLKENDVDVAEIQISDKRKKKWSRKNYSQTKLPKVKKPNYREYETTYIYGIHPKSKSTKERVWRVPNSWYKGWADSLNIGDILLVKTKYGLAPIEITRIETLSECPVDIPVKTVVKKLVDFE